MGGAGGIDSNHSAKRLIFQVGNTRAASEQAAIKQRLGWLYAMHPHNPTGLYELHVRCMTCGFVVGLGLCAGWGEAVVCSRSAGYVYWGGICDGWVILEPSIHPAFA